ncbi:MAG: helix-turn-helix domain-containing protein [Eubacteriales bacterium]|nr:helix-turn-helix domain-containing protein [Eubacteriales bacterium]
MRKERKCITYTDRKKIEKLIKAGASAVEIAESIGIHRATVYRELQRGGTPYKAITAQKTVM